MKDERTGLDVAGASLEARAEMLAVALLGLDTSRPSASVLRDIVRAVDASRPAAPERTFPRVTLGTVAPGSLIEIASGDIGVARYMDPLDTARSILWIKSGRIGVVPATSTVSLRATPAELDSLTSADASRPTPADEDTRPRLTERDADDIELARAIRDTLREVTHAGAIERLEELLDVEKEAAARPGPMEEQARRDFEASIRDAVAKGGPYGNTHAREAVAALDAALLRASRGETGPAPIDYPGVRDALRALAYAMCATQARDPEQKAQLQRAAEAHDALRYALGDKDPSGETGPADEPFEKIEQLPSGLTCPGCYAATGIAQPHDPRVTPATPWVKDAAFPGCEVQREGPEVVGVRSPNWATKKEDGR